MNTNYKNLEKDRVESEIDLEMQAALKEARTIMDAEFDRIMHGIRFVFLAL